MSRRAKLPTVKTRTIKVQPQQIKKIAELNAEVNGAQARLNVYLTGVLDGHNVPVGKRVLAMDPKKNLLTVEG